jgi:hypothetical protein
MSISAIVDSQSNDASEASAIKQPGQSLNEKEALEWSEASASEEESEGEAFDDDRAEDEDWEIAERGGPNFVNIFYIVAMVPSIFQISRNNTID